MSAQAYNPCSYCLVRPDITDPSVWRELPLVTHACKGVSETEYFLITSFSVLVIGNDDQRKLLSLSCTKYENTFLMKYHFISYMFINLFYFRVIAAIKCVHYTVIFFIIIL